MGPIPALSNEQRICDSGNPIDTANFERPMYNLGKVTLGRDAADRTEECTYAFGSQ